VQVSSVAGESGNRHNLKLSFSSGTQEEIPRQTIQEAKTQRKNSFSVRELVAMKMMKTERGFGHISVTQILLVLVVIGIVVAVAIPIVKKKNFEAKTEQVDSDLKGIKRGLKAYFEQHGEYPAAPAWDDQPQNATKEDCDWQRELIDAKILRRTFPDLFASADNKAYYYYQSGNRKWIVVSVGPDQKLARDYSKDFAEGTLVIYQEMDDIIVSNMDVVNRQQRYPSTSG
jgi:type II secretory pathway pseudopilin PulG